MKEVTVVAGQLRVKGYFVKNIPMYNYIEKMLRKKHIKRIIIKKLPKD